jgi:hypothetical protein
VNERRQRPDVIGQFLALVAEDLEFGLGRRISAETASNERRLTGSPGAPQAKGSPRTGRSGDQTKAIGTIPCGIEPSKTDLACQLPGQPESDQGVFDFFGRLGRLLETPSYTICL